MSAVLLDADFNEEQDHAVPTDLLELFEVLEFERMERFGIRESRFAASTESPIISRSGSGLSPPWGISYNIRPEGSTGHWEGPRMGTFPHSSCATKVRGIQSYHFSKGWSDIAYTSMYCPHGYIYVCRWWGVRTAANGTNDGNFRSYAHCYLSGDGDPFTDSGKRALARLLNLSRIDGKAGSRVWCHRDWKATACPGEVICGHIKKGIFDVPTAEPTFNYDPGHPSFLVKAGSPEEAFLRNYLSGATKTYEGQPLRYYQIISFDPRYLPPVIPPHSVAVGTDVDGWGDIGGPTRFDTLRNLVRFLGLDVC